MLNTSKTTVLGALVFLLLLLGLASALADPITVYAGKEGGGYDRRAKEIVQRLAQRGIEATVENRKGSDDITLQACRNPASIWIAQIDALYAREIKDGCVLPVLANYGTEVAALFFPPDTDKRKLHHLKEGDVVFVDGVGSGSELTWKTMVAIEQEHGGGDDWTKVRSETGALARVNALAARGNIDAVLLVRTTDSADFKRLLSSGWRLGELNDKDINDLVFGKTSLYEKTSVEIRDADGKKHDNTGYLVRSFIGTTEAMERGNAAAFDAMLGALE